MASRREQATKTREMPASRPEARDPFAPPAPAAEPATAEHFDGGLLEPGSLAAEAPDAKREGLPAARDRVPRGLEAHLRRGSPGREPLDPGAVTEEAPAAGRERPPSAKGHATHRLETPLSSGALGGRLREPVGAVETSVAEPLQGATRLAPMPAAARGRAARGELGAWLVVLEGPGAGKRFPLDGEEVSVGRSRRCDIRLEDPSISRVHLLLRRAGRAWVARDPGSENGVWVQGQAVRLHRLRDGDCMELGRSVIRFSSGAASDGAREAAAGGGWSAVPRRPRAGRSSAAASPAEAGRERPGGNADRARGAGLVALALGRAGKKGIRPLAAGPGLLGGLLLCGLAWAGILWSRGRGEEALAAEAQLPAHELFDAGLEALRGGAWGEARALFEEAARLEPEAEEPARYARRLAEEEGAAREAEQARRCLDDGDLDCALAALDRMGSEGLVHEREGRDLRLRLAGALGIAGEGEEAPAVEGEARGQAEGEGRMAVEALRAPSAEGLGKDRPPARWEEEKTPGRQARGAAPVPRRAAAPKARAPGSLVREAVARGDLEGALAALAASEERALAAEFEELQRALAAQAPGAEELPLLRQGLATLKKLGGSAALEARIREKLALGAAAEGQAALERGDLRAANRLFREARAQDPQSREARRGLEFLRGRAQGLLVEGYALRSRQPAVAREKLLLARELSAEGEEIHEKAKKWLATLDEPS